MTTNLVPHPSVPISAVISPRRISKVGLVGAGDVIRKKIWPALCARRGLIDALAVCGLSPSSTLPDLPHLYLPVVAGSMLPLDELAERGFLAPDTLWLVATPSELHVSYALQLAVFGPRVALEKPLASSYRLARLLLPCAGAEHEIYPLDHKLFNASALALVERCRQHPALLTRVRRIEACFYEPDGFCHGRRQEDGIADIQYHLLTILLALFAAGGGCAPEIEVEGAAVARHRPDGSGRFHPPTVWTASRLTGRLVSDGLPVAFDLRQAKGAPRGEKAVRLLDAGGAPVAEVDLNESGWHAHARVLDALLAPEVDMRHTLADAVEVMRLVDAGRALARECAAYDIGVLPEFLT